MANKHQSADYEQSENDWYKEPRNCVEQLFDAVDFPHGTIWDPACGTGNILDVARDRGFSTVGSDVVQRGARHPFYRQNFLTSTRWPKAVNDCLSIVTNPPFNNPPGAALNFIEKALDTIPFKRAAFILPIEFTCGQDRYERLFSKQPPSHVGFYSQRPSMPPGHLVEQLGDKAYKGGKTDFVALVWTAGGPYRTEAIWFKPSRSASPSDAPLRRRKPGQ